MAKDRSLPQNSPWRRREATSIRVSCNSTGLLVEVGRHSRFIQNFLFRTRKESFVDENSRFRWDVECGRLNAMSPIQNRHLSDRLIRAIESHAEEFAQSTVKKIRSSPRTESYRKVPDKDMYNRCYEVYHNLGRWLWEKSDQAVQERFNELGERRCEEGIPLAEVLWALVFTKDLLLEYLGAYGLADSALELYQQQELDRLICHFF